MSDKGIRSRLPRGVTKLRVVRLFQKGLSVEYIAGLIGCVPAVVEDVIRDVMARQS